MVRRRVIAAMLVAMMIVASGSASARFAVPNVPVAPISAMAAAEVAGGSWWGCVGFLSTVAAAAATGGIGGGLLGLAASFGLSVATACECGPYIDAAIGTDFVGMCGS